MICGATVFLLFWLHLHFLLSFKIVRKFYLPHFISWFLLDKDLVLGLWCTQILKLLVILHLALFNYFSIITADQNNSFYGQIQECYWSNFYLEVADQSMFTSTQHSDDDVCYVCGLPYNLCIYKVFMFILYRNRYTYLKVSS